MIFKITQILNKIHSKLPFQNGLRQLCISAIFISVWVHLGCGDTKWYHHNLDRHKDRVFTKKYGAIQVCFGEVVLL